MQQRGILELIETRKKDSAQKAEVLWTIFWNKPKLKIRPLGVKKSENLSNQNQAKESYIYKKN